MGGGYILILYTLLTIFIGCTTEINNSSGSNDNNTKKYSYTVRIDNASDFDGCTFEYTFYLDGEVVKTEKTTNSSTVFTTENPGKVKVDIVIYDGSDIIGERLGKDCNVGNTDVIIAKKTADGEKPTLASIEVLADDSNIYVDQTMQLTVQAIFSDGSEKEVTSQAVFTPSDSAVLSVSSSGEVKGLNKGTCTVTASYTDDGITEESSINFEVFGKDEVIPEKVLQGITLSQSSINLIAGETSSFTVKASYTNSTSNADVTEKAHYSSSNESVATAANGIITAKSSGTAAITVSYTENGVTKSAECSVAVKALSSIEFGESSMTINVNGEAEIVLYEVYSDGSKVRIKNGDVSFSSSNDSVVSVSSGVFEAKAVGKATITASYKGFTANISISVTTDVVLKSITLNVDGTKTPYKLTVTASYSSGTPKDVTSSAEITVSDESIASVTKNGGEWILTAKANGKVTVTAAYEENGETKRTQKEIEVAVDSTVLSGIAVTLSASSIEVGKTAQVTVMASYSDGTTKDVTNEATISRSGTAASLSGKTITGVSAGKTVITAEFGGKTASASITIKEAINGYRVHFYGASWSSYSIYYYNDDKTKVGDWPGKTMTKNADTYSYDLTESWVAGGTTMVIFFGGSDTDRYPADQQDGVILPVGVNEAWFNFATKAFETSNPFSTEPIVSVSPIGNASFSGTSQSVTVTAKNCTSAKYTTDASDPKTSSAAVSFSGSKSFTVGSGLSVGQSVTVRVWGTDGMSETSASAVYTKVEKSAIPTRLGAYYTSSATSFSIWSPDSSNVTVSVKRADGTEATYTCKKGFTVDGDYSDSANIYGVTVDGDLHLAEYQFKINGKAVRDPYGKMIKYEDNDAKTNVIRAKYAESNCTVTSYAGSSVNIVVDVDRISPSSGNWAARPVLENRAKSVVYEIHVGDFSSASSWGGSTAKQGKFAGLIESGTTYATVKTGLDHLVELGVTHVQILPMYDFATKYNETIGEYYNWGYDPVNYNVPEDRYSMTPTDYENRIREVKDMVDVLHRNGIRVIMDVVYNHTFDGEMFNNITKSYYTATDLSGCGNSINVTNKMVSRMVRDSLEYWLETYNLDGFRFDLMGIYSNDAIGDWGKYLNQKYSDRTLLLYGEPYQANNNNSTSYAYASSIPNLEYAGIGGFAHKFRETLKGGSDDGIKGYIFNATEKDGTGTAWNTQVGLKGSMTSLGSDSDGVWTRYFTKSPYQAVNYLAAHDNLCLYDKIVVSGIKDSAYQQAIVKFGHGIITLAQGVGFIHGGDDFLRTKSGGEWSEFKIDSRTAKENSYMFGQGMNKIDWSLKAKNSDLFKYHKDLIEFKKKHDGFWNGNASTSDNGMVIQYTVKDSNGKTLTCILNPGADMTYSGDGNQVFNKKGIISSSDSDYTSKKCEGTGITIFEQ
ncbi:MAG: Ig-like domain-containing protein [Spirochaetales bacterium]|nr:Ig-like domain-containing protein [Spirochaetales bacterium]